MTGSQEEDVVEEPQAPASAEETDEESPESEPAEAVVEEWPDPLALLLGQDARRIVAAEPLVVCVEDRTDDGFVAILETLLERLHREQVGDTPDATRVSTARELIAKRRSIGADGQIFSAKLSDREWNTLEETQGEHWDRIWRNSVSNQLYAQGFGAIVFNRRYISASGDHHPRTVLLDPDVPDAETQAELIRLFCGCWDDTAPTREWSFGQLFTYHRERVAEDRWAAVERAEDGLFFDVTGPGTGAGSDLRRDHRRMQTLVVTSLVDRLRAESDDLTTPTEVQQVVETERTFRQNGDVRASPDVVCEAVEDAPRGVFEVETLYADEAAGRTPRDRLREAFVTYGEIDAVDAVNVVLDPLSTMLHLETIRELTKSYRDWEDATGTTVEFYTLDLEEVRLVPVTSVVDRLRALEDAD